MSLIQVEISPETTYTSKIGIDAGLGSGFAVGSQDGSISFAILPMSNMSIVRAELVGYWAIASSATPSPTTTRVYTSVVRPLPELGNIAWASRMTLQTFSGTVLMEEYNLPRSIVNRNRQFEAASMAQYNIGNNYSRAKQAFPSLARSYRDVAVPFCVQPRLGIGKIPFNCTGGLRLQLDLASVGTNFVVPAGALPNSCVDTSTQPNVYVADETAWAVGTHVNSIALSGLTTLVNVKLLLTLAPDPSNSLTWERETITAYDVPAQSSVVQRFSLSIPEACISKLELYSTDRRLWEELNKCPLSTQAMVGTDTRWFIDNKQPWQRYYTWNPQPLTQAALTCSTNDLQIMYLSPLERQAIRRTLEGAYRRLYLNTGGQYVAQQVFTYQLHLYNIPYHYLPLSKVTGGRGNQGLVISWPAGTAVGVTPVPFKFEAEEWGNFLFPSESVRPMINRSGSLNIMAAGTLKTYSAPLWTPDIYNPKHEVSPQFNTFQLVIPSFRVWSVTPEGTVNSVKPPASYSSQELYKFDLRGRQSVTGLALLRMIQLTKEEPLFLGDSAWSFILPDGGWALKIYMATPVKYNVTGLQVPLASPAQSWWPVGQAASNRLAYSSVGEAGLFSQFTLYDSQGSVSELYHREMRVFDMLGYTHDEHVHAASTTGGGYPLRRKPDTYDKNTPLNDSIRLDAIATPHTSLLPYAAQFGNQLAWSDLDQTSTVTKIFVGMSNASSLFKQLEDVPLTGGRRMRFDFDQSGKWLFNISAGGAVFKDRQYDPFVELAQFTANSGSTRVSTDLTFGGDSSGSAPPIVYVRLGYTPHQQQLEQQLALQTSTIRIPRINTYPSYMQREIDLSITNYPSFTWPANKINSMFNPEMYPVAELPHAAIVQTVAGYVNPTWQWLPEWPLITPRRAYGHGALGYSIHAITSRNAVGTVSYLQPACPVMQPMVDGTTLDSTDMNTFGDWFHNAQEYYKITGSRMTIPFDQMLEDGPNLDDCAYPSNCGMTYAGAAITNTLAESLGSELVDSVVLCAGAHPPTQCWQFLSLGAERVGNRQQLALNWQFMGLPLTSGTLLTMPNKALAYQWLSIPTVSAATSTTMFPVSLQAQILPYLAFANGNQFTMLVHMIYHDAYSLSSLGIKPLVGGM